jgi:histidyl-tRNA synthetase
VKGQAAVSGLPFRFAPCRFACAVCLYGAIRYKARLDPSLAPRARRQLNLHMAKTSKDARPEPRLPKGLRDIEAAELRQQQDMLAKIRAVYERYGFEPLETPAFEYTDALGKFLPDQDRPNEGVFSLQVDDEQWLSLRYDLTAPLARYVAQNYQSLPKPFRRYAVGNVWRNEKPGPGRFRQFMQFDADTVGAESVAADAEMCMLAADTLEALGIKRGDYVIKVSNRKVLDGVMETVGLGGTENASRRLTVLRAIDKFDRLGFEAVRLLLGKGRRDESGDFTTGARLTEEQTANVMVLFEVPNMAEEALRIHKVPGKSHGASIDDIRVHENIRIEAIFGGMSTKALQSSTGLEGLSELRQIWKLIRSTGYDDGRIRIDPSVVRGLEYYTGPVFEAELTFEVKDEDGRPVRFGSVGGGGRYDDLVARFTGERVPATGFSIGVSRLQAALAALNKDKAAAAHGPVVVLVMEKDRVADYQKLVQTLRTNDIRAELYLGSSGMKAQMKYADKRGSPCVVIQGSDERAAGKVTLKDLVEGAKAAAIKDNKEWKEARPAQVLVDEKDLVPEVRKILGRHRL